MLVNTTHSVSGWKKRNTLTEARKRHIQSSANSSEFSIMLLGASNNMELPGEEKMLCEHVVAGERKASVEEFAASNQPPLRQRLQT